MGKLRGRNEKRKWYNYVIIQKNKKINNEINKMKMKNS